MELRRSQRRTRITQRIPLSNLTNARSLSSSSSSVLTLKPVKPKSSDPISTLSSNSNVDAVPTRSSSSIASSGPKIPSHRKIPKPDGSAKAFSRNFVDDKTNFGNSKHSVVNARDSTEGRNDKGNAQMGSIAFSCPPRGWNTSTRGKLKDENRDVAELITSSVPHKKSKKTQQHMMLDDDVLWESPLPKDYIERQRAYFAEVDAYDLAEEVISERELE